MPTRFNFDELIKSPGVNLGLIRRKSLIERRSMSLNASLADSESLQVSVIDSTIPEPRLPMEMLDKIIKFYFDSVLTSNIIRRDSQQKVFARDIEPLTLVSRDIRYLILQKFCQNLSFVTQRDADTFFYYLSSVADSLKSSNWTGGFTWVRTLSAPAFLLPKTVFVLKHFEKLQDLIIDCSHCTLSSQIATLSRLFDALSDKHNLVPNLRALIMTNVPRLDESLLNTIAGSLRQVVNLHVSTIEGIEMDCCRNCYEESLIRVLHSPIQNYHDGKDMAKKFADALRDFHDLKNLHLGILLSHCDLLAIHSIHDSNDARPSTVNSIPSCPHCTKYAEETRRHELSIGLGIAIRLVSLESISWATAFTLSSSGGGKVSAENCVECDIDVDVDSYCDSLQYSVINTRHNAEDMDHDRWKIASFAVERTKEKIRLSRIA